MGNTYPNHKGNYYYRNHTLYHVGTLDPLDEASLSPYHQQVHSYMGISVSYLEGQGDLVSRSRTPITHIVTLVISIINPLTKSP